MVELPDSATVRDSNRRGHAAGDVRRRIPAHSIPAMAAAYLFRLCQNHPFIDGNKVARPRETDSASACLRMAAELPALNRDYLGAGLVLSVASSQLGKRRSGNQTRVAITSKYSARTAVPPSLASLCSCQRDSNSAV